jgi:DNA-binding NarL/FixJ family response regulator
MNRVKILLADDHLVVREGVRTMLELEADMEVIGEASDGRAAVALALKLKPDVILMDIAMPELNGLEATRQILRILPATKIIILSAHGDDAFVHGAIAAKASGFLLKQSSFLDLCKSIREVRRGIFCMSASQMRRYRHLHPQPGPGAPSPDLTSREMEILQLVAEGKANKQCAAALGISIKTVEKHRGSLMAKLDIHDTAGLTRHALAIGLIEK